MPNRKTKQFGYLIAIAVNFLILYVFKNLRAFFPSYVTSDWSIPLAVANFSIRATIFANAVWVFFDEKRFKAALQILLNILAIWFLWLLFAVFPFDLAGTPLNPFKQFVPFIFLIAIFGTVIAVIAEFVKILLPDKK